MTDDPSRLGLDIKPLWRLVVLLAAALLLAWFASVTPAAAPVQAPADRFSADRAILDIQRLAQVPHPSGSAQNARVRADLIARLRSLGLSPQVQNAAGIRSWGSSAGPTFAVENVLVRVAGTDPSAPALLVMSHYDSVRRSPGAADDMAGVASALEIARLLKHGPQPRRDVLFAFTDGEEIGLIGAQALFADPVASRNIGLVLNMDVRGGGGRAFMFQTGRNPGGAVRLFAAHPDRPQSNSLAAYLYEQMPNDTDFSVSLAHGLPGLNYAFIGRPALYHTPAAVPRSVEPGAVQSLGGQVWAMVQALAFAAALPAASPGPTWFDLFGRMVVVYPPAFGWIPVGLGGALLAAAAWRQRKSAGLRLGDMAQGAARSLLATVVAGALLYLYGRLTVHGYYSGLAHAGRTEIVTAAVVLAASLLALRIGRPPERPQGRWLGAALLGWLIALMLQASAPTAAFIVAWPVLSAALALTLCSASAGRMATASALASCAVGLGCLMETWHAVVLGAGLTLPPVGVAFLPIALSIAAPWLMTTREAEPTPAV